MGATPVQTTESPPILISEIAYDTVQDDEFNEWVELLIVSDTPIVADQIKVGDEETIGGGEGMMRFPKNTVLQPGEVIVIAQSAVEFKAEHGIYPHFEFKESTADVPNMRPVSLLAKGDVFFSNSGDEVIVLSDKNKPLDQISYGDSNTRLDPPILPVGAGFSLERVPPNCDTNTAADFRPQRNPTPFLVPDFEECPEPVTTQNTDPDPEFENKAGESSSEKGEIGKIQGTSDADSKVNQTVQFEGIVTAVTADKNVSGITFYTLFVQDNGDLNDLTSDAIPVFTGRQSPTVRPGDRVKINGRVTEFFGLTEIDDDELTITKLGESEPLPQPIQLTAQTLPSESLEGMRVSLPEAIAAGPTFETDAGCGFSVIPLNSRELPIIRTSINDSTDIIIPILPNDDRDCDKLPVVKRGDQLQNLQGVLTWNFEQWKLVQDPAVPIQITAGPPLPLPEPISLKEKQISIATLNVENLFDSIDDTGQASEPKLSAAEIAVRLDKFSRLIGHWLGCPTLIGIQEVEKEHLLLQLSETLEPVCGFKYGVAHLESYDGRGIDNALLFDPRSTHLTGIRLHQSCSRITTGIDPQGFACETGQEPLFSRPPLEVNLMVENKPLTVYINHFKSKRGGERETAPRRLAQAEFQAQLVTGNLAERSGPIVVLGDFNDFSDSPTQKKIIENGNLENALKRLPQNEQYTFNFGGAGQLIDGVFLTADLADQLEQVSIMHLNSDYPDAFQLDTSAEALDFKSTDHDPAVVVLNWSDVESGAIGESQAGEADPIQQSGPAKNDDQISDSATLIERILNSAWRFLIVPIAVLIGTAVLIRLFVRK